MKNLQAIVVILFIILYTWVSFSTAQSFKNLKGLNEKFEAYQKSNIQSNYQILADSFLTGHLYVPIEPSAEFKKLSNPYDPLQNKDFISQYGDHSYYKNKFYLYFGPVPALIFNLPFRLFTNLKLPDRFIILFFISGTLIVSTLILNLLKRKYFNQIPSWMILLSISIIGSSDLRLYLLSKPSIYQSAIASSTFFTIGAIYLFLKIIINSRINNLMLATGGFLLGLGIGSRPTNILVALSLLLLMSFTIRRFHKHPSLSLFVNIAFLITPFFVCLLLLGLYNYLRFENFFEFGFKYQIQYTNLTKLSAFDFKNICSNFYFYFLQPPFLYSQFPFLHLNYWTEYWRIRPIPHSIWDEESIGLIYFNSFICMTLICPLIILINSLSRDENKGSQSLFPKYEFCIILSSALINIFQYLLFNGVQLRYMAENLTLLIISSSILWFYINSKFSSMYRLSTNTLAICLGTLSIISGFILSLFKS